ncbi:hypothetical protein Salat_0868200 [Sesamum alatum]|uniref:DUF4283 domain-containing protein n=1 Tax=Sesamum alatum TaxID=300844 RepID=A0AAE1YJ38_9LAMI|nr:hypothetical protein Salat_0868200 [Sesamum alatum]
MFSSRVAGRDYFKSTTSDRLYYSRASPFIDWWLMEESLAEIERALSMAEQENADIVIRREVWGLKTDYTISLVGRVLMRRTYNFEALKDVLGRGMNPRKGMQFQRIDNDRFIIKFNHPVDMKKALDGGPWNFDKSLVILDRIAEHEKPATIDLSWCKFTVYVHNLQHAQRTKSMAEFIDGFVDPGFKTPFATWLRYNGIPRGKQQFPMDRGAEVPFPTILR